MSKSGETGLGGERQHDDLDIHVHPYGGGRNIEWIVAKVDLVVTARLYLRDIGTNY